MKHNATLAARVLRLFAVFVSLTWSGCPSQSSAPTLDGVTQDIVGADSVSDSRWESDEIEVDTGDVPPLSCGTGTVSVGDGCVPQLPASCSPSETLLADGRCVSVGPTGCPKLWDAVTKWGQPELDGCKAGEALECPKGTTLSKERTYCEPVFEQCAAGTIPRIGGGCVPVGPKWEATQGSPPHFDHCGESELPLPGGGCVAVGPLACDRLWNPLSQEDCEIGAVGACPGGWQATSDGEGLFWCEPNYDDCPSGASPVLGGGCLVFPDRSEGCAESYPEASASPNTLRYVNAASSCLAECGSKEAPFPTIQQAIDHSPEGSVLLVAKGNYDGFTVNKSVQVLGACASAVVIQSLAAVQAESDSVPEFAGVSVVGTQKVVLGGIGVNVDGPGIVVHACSDVSLQDMEVAGARGNGLWVSESDQVSATHLWVRDTEADLSKLVESAGVRVESSSATFDAMLVERNAGAGLRILDSASVALTESTVRDSMAVEAVAGLPPVFGSGVDVSDATVMLSRCLLERNALYQAVGHAGSNISVTESTIRDTTVIPKVLPSGTGVMGEYGAQINIAWSILHDIRSNGVISYDNGTQVRLSNTTVRNVRLGEQGISSGARIEIGGSVKIEASAVLQCDLFGISMYDPYENASASVEVFGSYIGGTTATVESVGSGVGVWGGSALFNTVVVSSNEGYGLGVDGPESVVTIVGGTVRRSLPTEFGDPGVGLFASGEAQVSLSHVHFSENHVAGMLLTGKETSVSATDCMFEDTLPVDGSGGHGVEVFSKARFVAQSVLVKGNTEAGILCDGAGSSLDLTDVFVGDTAENAGQQGGFGVAVGTGANAVLRRCEIAGNHRLGVQVSALGSSLELLESVVRDTGGAPSKTAGLGAQCTAGADFAVSDSLFEGNTEIGVSAAGGTVRLAGCVVRGTNTKASGTLGIGVQSREKGKVTVVGCLVEGNSTAGMNVAESGSELSVADTLIRDTLSDSANQYGMGLQVNLGGTAKLTRVVLQANRSAGILVGKNGSVLEAFQVVVTDTLPSAAGLLGQGLQIQNGANGTCSGCLFTNNTQVGVSAFGSDTVLSLQGSLVLDTRPESGGVGGMGVVAGMGAFLRLGYTAVLRNSTSGLYAANAGTRVVVDGSWFEGTLPGLARLYVPEDPVPEFGSFGDGLLVDDQADAKVGDSVVRLNARTAAYYHKASGSLDGCVLTGNDSFGLAIGEVAEGVVTYGTSKPNFIAGNGAAAVEPAATLAAPYICVPPECQDLQSMGGF